MPTEKTQKAEKKTLVWKCGHKTHKSPDSFTKSESVANLQIHPPRTSAGKANQCLGSSSPVANASVNLWKVGAELLPIRTIGYTGTLLQQEPSGRVRYRCCNLSASIVDGLPEHCFSLAATSKSQMSSVTALRYWESLVVGLSNTFPFIPYFLFLSRDYAIR